jgi:hypothetical protein
MLEEFFGSVVSGDFLMNLRYSERGKLSKRSASVRLPDPEMDWLDKLGSQRSVWLRNVLIPIIRKEIVKEAKNAKPKDQ